VADADGEFDNNQRLAVREICRVVGLSLKEFDLELKAPDPQKLPPPVTAPKRREPPPVFPVPMSEGDSGESVSGGEGAKGKGGVKPGPEDDSKGGSVAEQSETKPKGPSKTETEKDAADLPEWMRNPPEKPAKILHSPGSSGDSKKKSGPPVPDEDLPEWMKNPPVPGDSGRGKGDSASRAEKQKENSDKENESLPEWMRNP
jgi:hypothetical protein